MTDREWARTALSQVELALVKLQEDLCGTQTPKEVAELGLKNLRYARELLDLDYREEG